MLVKIDYLDHKINKLVVYFENYLTTIEEFPKGQVFDVNNCPDADLNKQIKTDTKGNHNALKKKFIAFHKSFLDLIKNDRTRFIKIFKDTNNFPWILQNPAIAVKINKYPGNTGSTSHALLKHLFEKTMGLKAFDIKDHYQNFYDTREDRWCPFCGMELYKVPERQREDYDHLLCKKDYPAAAINMKNLIPMGEGCNRRYKKDIDVLNCLGKATKIVHPYSESIEPHISLKGSKLHTDEAKCSWTVGIHPRTDKVKAWNAIFKIDERCKEEFLIKRPRSKQDPEFKRMILDIIQICQVERKINGGGWSWNDLKIRLEKWIENLKPFYYMNANMIKVSLYDFLINEADQTYQLALVDMINQK